MFSNFVSSSIDDGVFNSTSRKVSYYDFWDTRDTEIIAQSGMGDCLSGWACCFLFKWKEMPEIEMKKITSCDKKEMKLLTKPNGSAQMNQFIYHICQV